MLEKIMNATKSTPSFTAEGDKIAKAILKAQEDLEKLTIAKNTEIEELRQTEENLYLDAKEYVAVYEEKYKKVSPISK